MTEDEFDDRFTTVLSPQGSTVWEFDEVFKANIPTKRVWTFVDTDDGGTAALPGWHVVNQFGYMVTKQPWEIEADEVIFPPDLPEPEGDPEGDMVTFVIDTATEPGPLLGRED